MHHPVWWDRCKTPSLQVRRSEARGPKIAFRDWKGSCIVLQSAPGRGIARVALKSKEASLILVMVACSDSLPRFRDAL